MMPILFLALLIALTPLVLSINGTLRLTCTVPHDAGNRLLSYGVVDYSASERDIRDVYGPLDVYGHPTWIKAAPRTWQIWIPHVPAGSGLAYCAVTNNVGKITRVTQRFVMVDD